MTGAQNSFADEKSEDLKHNDSTTSFGNCSTSSQKFLLDPKSNNSASEEIVTNNNLVKMKSQENGKETPNIQETEDIKKSDPIFVPPDGGCQAWLVMICSFLTNGVIFGIINSFGVIFVYLKDRFGDDSDAATKASLIGSSAIGTTFFLSAVSSILVDKFGIRTTAFCGGLIAFLGMYLSSFCLDSGGYMLFLTYGVMFGGGSSLAYTPSLVILGHYFKRHMGLVNGFVTSGSSIFTMAMPHIMRGIIDAYEEDGLKICIRFLAGITAIQMVAALSFKPLMPKIQTTEQKSCISQVINVDNWKNKKYVIWALAIPSALFGYFVPYVHIVQHVKDTLPDDDGSTLVTCIAVTSGIGRLIFGKIADLPNVNRIFLQQISFICIGICTMLLTAAPYFKGFEFESMIVFSLIMGIFDGCFITMLGPIAYDICGPAGASQAVGFLLGLCSIPLTIGPAAAGYLYDWLGNYTIPFIAAGIPPIMGALFMCLIYRVSSPNDKCLDVQVEEALEPQIDPGRDHHRETLPSLIESRTATSALSAESTLETESLLVHKNGSSVAVENA